MPKFDVALNIIVEADSVDDAFSDVRSNFCVVNDPARNIKVDTVAMFVGDVTPVDDDTDVADYA